jgi:tetratricopeptide (TPR) repeat protein
MELRLVSGLWRYWLRRGLATRGRRALDDLVARAPQTQETAATRASALLGAGWMARFQGDHAAAQRQLTQSVALFSALGDRAGEAEALSNLAGNLIYIGEADEGERVGARALELARAAGDPYVTGYCLQTFGDQCASRGAFARAGALLGEGVAVLRTLGHEQSLAFALAKLGNLLLQQGELAAARTALEEAYALHRRLGEGLGIDHTLLRLGWLTHHEGDDAQAVPLLEHSLTIAERAGFVPEAALALSMLGRLALQRGEPNRAAQLLTDGLVRSLRVRSHDACANCLEGLAMVAIQRHRPTSGARLLGAAERIREGAVRPLAPIDLPDYRSAVRALHSALKKAEFDAAWKRGRAMTTEEVSAEALNRQSARSDAP